jgi:hypothetical protein
LIASLEKEASEIAGKFVTLLIKSCESMSAIIHAGFGERVRALATRAVGFIGSSFTDAVIVRLLVVLRVDSTEIEVVYFAGLLLGSFFARVLLSLVYY